jgi:hypothetical protein
VTEDDEEGVSPLDEAVWASCWTGPAGWRGKRARPKEEKKWAAGKEKERPGMGCWVRGVRILQTFLFFI